MLSKSERALAKPALAEEKLPDADQNHYAENLLLAKAQARNNGWVYGISFENAQPAAIRNSQIMLNNNDGPDRKYPEITGLGQVGSCLFHVWWHFVGWFHDLHHAWLVMVVIFRLFHEQIQTRGRTNVSSALLVVR